MEDDDDDGGEDAYGFNNDGELSFDYRQDGRGQNVVPAAKNSMEVSVIIVLFSPSFCPFHLMSNCYSGVVLFLTSHLLC